MRQLKKSIANTKVYANKTMQKNYNFLHKSTKAFSRGIFSSFFLLTKPAVVENLKKSSLLSCWFLPYTYFYNFFFSIIYLPLHTENSSISFSSFFFQIYIFNFFSEFSFNFFLLFCRHEIALQDFRSSACSSFCFFSLLRRFFFFYFLRSTIIFNAMLLQNFDRD